MELEEYRKKIRECFHTQDLGEMEPIVNHFDSLPPVEKIQFWNAIFTFEGEDLSNEVLRNRFAGWLGNIFAYRVSIACNTPDGQTYLGKQTYKVVYGIQVGT
jgi:hypothetical protein